MRGKVRSRGRPRRPPAHRSLPSQSHRSQHCLHIGSAGILFYLAGSTAEDGFSPSPQGASVKISGTKCPANFHGSALWGRAKCLEKPGVSNGGLGAFGALSAFGAFGAFGAPCFLDVPQGKSRAWQRNTVRTPTLRDRTTEALARTRPPPPPPPPTATGTLLPQYACMEVSGWFSGGLRVVLGGF